MSEKRRLKLTKYFLIKNYKLEELDKLYISYRKNKKERKMNELDKDINKIINKAYNKKIISALFYIIFLFFSSVVLIGFVLNQDIYQLLNTFENNKELTYYAGIIFWIFYYLSLDYESEFDILLKELINEYYHIHNMKLLKKNIRKYYSNFNRWLND